MPSPPWPPVARVGKLGATRMLRSRGSLPYGNVAPALVSLTPASPASRDDPVRAAVRDVEADEVAALRLASTSPTPVAAESRSRISVTACELRRQDARRASACALDAGGVAEEAHVAELVQLVGADRLHAESAPDTRRRWLRSPRSAPTPAPAKLIFDVDPKISARSGFPRGAQAASMFASGGRSSTRWCTA